MIENNGFFIDPYTIDEARSAVRAIGHPGTYDYMKINANVVNLSAGGSNPHVQRATTLFDVTINSAEGFILSLNNINTQNVDHLDYSNRWGFYIHDWISPSSEHTIQWNKVIGSATAFDYGMCAFHFKEVGPWDICNNETDSTLRGFHLNKMCSPSVFGGNIMGLHRHSSSLLGNTEITAALLLENTTTIGPQFCRHNQFTYGNYAPDNAAEHRGSVTNVNQSLFSYNPAIPTEQPVPVAAAGGWFLLDFTCSDTVPNYHCGEEGHKYKEYLSENELAVLEKNQSFAAIGGASAWEGRRQLMAKLLRYPQLKIDYPAAGIFFDQQIGSSAGRFAQWDQQMDQAMLIEPGSLEALQLNRDQVTSLMEELDQLDATLTTPEAIAQADSAFFAARAALLGQINALSAEETALIAAINETRTSPLNALVETLGTLPQTAQYEQNQVFLNGLVIKTARGEAFSTEDYTLLRIIAAQCPYVAGASCDQAMDRLPVGDPIRRIQETSEVPNCTEDRDAQADPLKASPVDLTLWPNPTESTLFADFRSPFSGKIQVFNLTGESVLWSTELQAENYVTIPAQQLVPGIYMLIATDILGRHTVRKFVSSPK